MTHPDSGFPQVGLQTDWCGYVCHKYLTSISGFCLRTLVPRCWSGILWRFKTHEGCFLAGLANDWDSLEKPLGSYPLPPIYTHVSGLSWATWIHAEEPSLCHEGGCSLAQRRWLLYSSFNGDAHQRAEGCSAAAFSATLEAHCKRPSARLVGHAERGRAARRGHGGCGCANWLPLVRRLLVVTWGNPRCGGDSSQVQEQLRSVKHIQATESAFGAMLESGAVVT